MKHLGFFYLIRQLFFECDADKGNHLGQNIFSQFQHAKDMSISLEAIFQFEAMVSYHM